MMLSRRNGNSSVANNNDRPEIAAQHTSRRYDKSRTNQNGFVTNSLTSNRRRGFRREKVKNRNEQIILFALMISFLIAIVMLLIIPSENIKRYRKRTAFSNLSLLRKAASSDHSSLFIDDTYDSESNTNSNNDKEARTSLLFQKAIELPNYNHIYDIIIVGSGPAGLSAAIFGARSGLSVYVLGSEAGLLSQTSKLDNYPSWWKTTGSSDADDATASASLGGSGLGGEDWLTTTKEQAILLGAKFASPGILTNRLTKKDNSIKKSGNSMKEEKGGSSFELELQNFSAQHDDDNDNNNGNKIRGYSVIVATGATPRKLQDANVVISSKKPLAFQKQKQEDVLVSMDKIWGKSVHNCAICDGSSYHKKHIVVVGGGDAAIDAALLLSTRYKNRVTLIHRRKQFRATNQRNIQLLQSLENVQILTPYVVEKFEASDSKDHIKLAAVHIVQNITQSIFDSDAADTSLKDKQERRRIVCDGAFIMIGADPNTKWLQNSGVQLDNDGLIKLQQHKQFNNGAIQYYSRASMLPGVFAAGEVSDDIYRQAITAAAEGAQAAIDAERWLRETRGDSNRLPNDDDINRIKKKQPIKREVEQQTSKIITSNILNYTTKDEGIERVCDLVQLECIQILVKIYPVVVFSKPRCPYCRKAIEAIHLEGVANPTIVDIHAIDIYSNKENSDNIDHKIRTKNLGRLIQYQTLKELTGRSTVPNVFVGGKSIGGGDETVQLQRSGQLKQLLKNAGAIKAT